MLLEERYIEEFVQNIKVKKQNIERISIQFKPGRKPYVLIEGDVVSDIYQGDEYYLNVKENIIALGLSWFSPLCKFFGASLYTNIEVGTDGNFDNDEVEIVSVINPPHRMSRAYIYNRLKAFVLFYPFMEMMELGGAEGRLITITFRMKLKTSLVMRYLNNPDNINRQLLGQWTNTIGRCSKENMHNYRYFESFRAINGRFDYESRKQKTYQHFNLRRRI